MIEVKGTAEEIVSLLKDISPGYPADLISHLDPGLWLFYRNEVGIRLIIERPSDGPDC